VSFYAKKDFELSNKIPCEQNGSKSHSLTAPINSVIVPAGLKFVFYSGTSYSGTQTVIEGPAQTNLATIARSYEVLASETVTKVVGSWVSVSTGNGEI